MLTVLVICLPAFLPAPPVGRVRLGGIPLAGVSVLERSSRSAVVMADDPEAVAKAAAAAAKAAAAKAATATREKVHKSLSVTGHLKHFSAQTNGLHQEVCDNSGFSRFVSMGIRRHLEAECLSRGQSVS